MNKKNSNSLTMLVPSRKFLQNSGVLPLRAPDRPSFNPNVRAINTGRRFILVQLLAGSGRHSRKSHFTGHVSSDVGDDVHGSSYRHSSSSLR